jgi:hypothetical protein
VNPKRRGVQALHSVICEEDDSVDYILDDRFVVIHKRGVLCIGLLEIAWRWQKFWMLDSWSSEVVAFIRADSSEEIGNYMWFCVANTAYILLIAHQRLTQHTMSNNIINIIWTVTLMTMFQFIRRWVAVFGLQPAIYFWFTVQSSLLVKAKKN